MSVPFIQKELLVDLNTAQWQVKEITKEDKILGPVDYGWKRYKENPEVFTFGEGLLASSSIPGSRRMVFCGYSPQWESFYISSMGGAAYTFQHVGVNYVCLSGRCEKPSVLLLNNDGDNISVRLEPFEDYQQVWKGYKTRSEDYDGEEVIGIYALQHAIFDRWADEYDKKRVRAFVVGPAGELTNEGTIASTTVKKGKFTAVVDWCGRGGMGSRLFHQHNIVGCLFGGDWVDPYKPKARDTDVYFTEHFGDKGVKVDKAATVKYYYDPKIKTGGTFGANLHNIGDMLMTFNYRSTSASNEERLKQHKDFIVDHYLKQYNEETIATKNFDHCGEPCATACKKLNGKYKKDYEPYHALGPQCGVFDQRAAEILNDHADAMGMDAIQIGGTLAWIMECVAHDLIPADKFGFPDKSEMKFQQFTADTKEFDLVKDSLRNAQFAIKLINAILFDERAAVFRKGIRLAAYDLNEQYPDTEPLERAVFLSHADNGHMVPNQYWVPGMGSPMPLMGKYYVFYGGGFTTPDDLGRKNVERMVYELISDNCGICRFHRQWSEPLCGIIINDRFDLDIDFKEFHYQLAQEINEHEKGKAVPWETRRMAELFFNYLGYCGSSGSEDNSLFRWQNHDDIQLTAQAFWQAILNAQEQAFQAGHDNIADSKTPAQYHSHV